MHIATLWILPMLFFVLIPLRAMAAPSPPLLDEELQQEAEELVPWIEEHTGRTFVRIPRVTTASVDELVNLVLAGRRPVLLPKDVKELPPPSAERIAEARSLANASATYLETEETIYFVPEKFEEAERLLDLTMEQWRRQRSCTLVHELVHALQHQYSRLWTSGHRPDGPDKKSIYALFEGHATLISLDYCHEMQGADIVQLVQRRSGVDLIGSAPREYTKLKYVYGHALMTLIRERGGEEAIWAALNSPPPSWGALITAITQGLPAGWDGPRLWEAAQEAMKSPALTDNDTPLYPPLMSTLLEQDTVPKTLAGRFTHSTEYRRKIMGFALLYQEPRVAQEGLARRRNLLTRWWEAWFPVSSTLPSSLHSLRSSPMRGLERRREITATLAVRGRGENKRYGEYWIATERMLAMITVEGDRYEAKHARAALSGILATVQQERPVEAPLPVAVSAWLTRIERLSQEAQAPSINPRYKLGRATLALSQGATDACRTELMPSPTHSEEDTQTLLTLSYWCAVYTQDLELADVLLSIVIDPPIGVLAQHAGERILIKRYEEALVLLDQLPEDHQHAASLRLYALAGLNRMRELSELARVPLATPEARFGAAMHLLESGHILDSFVILKEVCPEVELQEERACEYILSGMP